MRSKPLLTAMSRNTRAKWFLITAIGTVDLIWMGLLGFRITEGY